MDGHSKLTPEREGEIYETVMRLVGEHGYDRLTVQQITTATRASTATLYRRWNGKARLVVEALRHAMPPPLSGIDTGSLHGDFVEGARRMAEVSERYASVMSALAHASRTDPDLHEAVNDVLITPITEATHHILDRATARGEVAAAAPGREFIPELLLGSILARRAVTGRSVDEEFLARFVDTVILPVIGVH
ncbi:TetR-like C-terminal domain-containing protein [Streptomyces sp. NBC_00582]|uniref:TetR-like C-terminal domain-containing protein n=1 Tax=Streptomyces sp. NBC_00582 TaxID=2975783 RepID=UPI0010641512|nr:TetR-like C-terminal domain-containing protein [Streptomyces sp. NBC_00582]WUB66044.1 TetR/AcrR family transcriptional regulator C-terminal ligand-binding domain-containing protein [Streptomyces sp. NBC_00582]